MFFICLSSKFPSMLRICINIDCVKEKKMDFTAFEAPEGITHPVHHSFKENAITMSGMIAYQIIFCYNEVSRRGTSNCS